MAGVAGLPASSPGRIRSGIALMFCCAFTFASLDALAKFLSSHVPTLQLVWFRYFFHMVTMLVVFGPVMRSRLWRAGHLRWQATRGVILIVCTCLSFTGLSLMPLAEFTAIAFIAPLIVTLLARPLLGERVSMARWVAVTAGFVGILIVIRPGGGMLGWPALIPLVMAGVYAMFQILSRKFAGADDPVTTLFFSGLIGAVLTTLVVPLVWVAPQVSDWPLLIMLGVMGAGGHLMLILAFRRAPASTLAPISYTQLVFATVLGIAVSQHIPDRWSLIGMGVIALAGLCAAILQGLEGPDADRAVEADAAGATGPGAGRAAGRRRDADVADVPTGD